MTTDATGKTEKEKMLAGELYRASDEYLASQHVRARVMCRRFNDAPEEDIEGRRDILKELLGTCGDDTFMESGFKCDYGWNIHVGKKFYANYGLMILDVCEVRIGENCLIAPNVCIFTATHPLDAATRLGGLELGAPVTIGNNVWIGGGAIINPGVVLGDNVVVASGAVVTRSFGDNVLLAGVPAKVVKKL